MTNSLVGDVYLKIIEEVVAASTTDFEESGVASGTLAELQQEWQAKLSQRGVAQMPWDPKPAPPQPAATPQMPAANNGMSPANYPSFDQPPAAAPRVKTEPGTEQYGMPAAYPPQNGAPPTQGGLARAQQLVQQQYGAAMPRGGLALPGQQPPRPNGAPVPQQNAPLPPHLAQQQFQQQQAAAMAQRQQQFQQARPPIKVENGAPNYSQTDGADDDASDDLRQWRALLAERRAVAAEDRAHVDRRMHDQILQMSADLHSGLMLPAGSSSSRPSRRPRRAPRPSSPSLAQLDGADDSDDEDEDDEDAKFVPPAAAVPDDDDENAINSDLDDSDDAGPDAMGDDDDDDGDAILCTYDKVQRVKNKWKCTLKDGVMIVNGRDWVFHKGMGEFEW